MHENFEDRPHGAGNGDFFRRQAQALDAMERAGVRKHERILGGAQGPVVTLSDGSRLINLCANNYLGLSNHPRIVAAAAEALASHGFGLSSVRFICGTQDLHKQLERRIADFLGMEEAILYGSAFDANGGLFEPLFDENDAIVSDELNHASIIDGIRLCKAQRYRYRHDDMDSLEQTLNQARQAGAREILVFTDGVFSMDGTIASLDRIRSLCDRFGALLGIDECHATGVLGARGRGTHEHRGVMGRVDIITGTFGKALGGASGGFTAGRRELVGILRQRSRPYLFSNSLAPAIAAASLCALDLLDTSPELLERLRRNTADFRAAMAGTGLRIGTGDHPIVPVMVGDAALAQRLSTRLLELGVYAVGFSHPVVPLGKARIRVQISAALEPGHLDHAVSAFVRAAGDCGMPA